IRPNSEALAAISKAARGGSADDTLIGAFTSEGHQGREGAHCSAPPLVDWQPVGGCGLAGCTRFSQNHEMDSAIDFVVAIPARHGSTRLPGKPLLPIAGVPMI